MKRILLFGAGKAATTLIQYLGKYCEQHEAELVVCDQNLELAQSKVQVFKSSYAITFNVADKAERQSAISKADIVISMLPAALHILVAQDCLLFYKDLLTASYIDPRLHELADEIKNRGILFLSEMGLDPGIDHMSAMRVINNLKNEGAVITSFKSYCGGLVAPESDDNPWRYKITWNPMNVVEAGTAGAIYLEEGKEKHIPYPEVFSFDNQILSVKGLDDMAWYANRDSLSYKAIYGLKKVNTFMRATLRYPRYNKVWYLIATIGLPDLNDGQLISGCKTTSEWFYLKLNTFRQKHSQSPVLDLLKEDYANKMLHYLGLYDDTPLPADKSCSGKVMLSVIVDKLRIGDKDKDMIVMVHEFEYKLNNESHKLKSTLIVKGKDRLNTAMSQTVGLPLAIGTKLILEGKIKETGLHIPIIPEIYNPILEELRTEGVSFEEESEF